MSPDQPRELSDEEINEAGPEATKEASSPLYATKTPNLHEDAEPEKGDVVEDGESEEA